MQSSKRIGLDLAQDALDKMRAAHESGKGCLLTYEMLASLNLTLIGKMWRQPRTTEVVKIPRLEGCDKRQF